MDMFSDDRVLMDRIKRLPACVSWCSVHMQITGIEVFAARVCGADSPLVKACKSADMAAGAAMKADEAKKAENTPAARARYAAAMGLYHAECRKIYLQADKL